MTTAPNPKHPWFVSTWPLADGPTLSGWLHRSPAWTSTERRFLMPARHTRTLGGWLSSVLIPKRPKRPVMLRCVSALPDRPFF